MPRNTDDTIDLTQYEGPGDLSLRLRCTGCPARTVPTDGPGEGVDEVPPLRKPVRHQSDPKTVVRCAECGKKHGKDSLTLVPPGG